MIATSWASGRALRQRSIRTHHPRADVDPSTTDHSAVGEEIDRRLEATGVHLA